MERVADLESLATHLGPVIYAPDRLAALERTGTIVDPAIPTEVRAALAADVLGVRGRRAAAIEVGPSVPISVTVGVPAAQRNREASTINGFDIAATVNLASMDDILAKLWEGLTYPSLEYASLTPSRALAPESAERPSGSATRAQRCWSQPPRLGRHDLPINLMNRPYHGPPWPTTRTSRTASAS